MQKLPIVAQPSQTMTVMLGAQQCSISIYQRYGLVFLDLTINGVRKITGTICRDRVNVARHAYTGFAGKLAFVDTQGTSDPEYTGFGTRYQLAYVPS